jgi:hypothetical protein
MHQLLVGVEPPWRVVCSQLVRIKRGLACHVVLLLLHSLLSCKIYFAPTKVGRSPRSMKLKKPGMVHHFFSFLFFSFLFFSFNSTRAAT